MNAHDIITALKGHWHGSYGMVHCPVPNHGNGSGDPKPSLKVTDHVDAVDIILHCFAGCDFRDARDALRRQGLLPEGPQRADRRRGHQRDRASVAASKPKKTNGDRIEYARSIWEQAEPASGTLAETYLRSRDIEIEIPPTIGFAYLKHVPTAATLPCMVCKVQGPDGSVIGVHRTYLREDGTDKAPVTPNRMMLGKVITGAVRLAKAGPEIVIAEGLETALSVLQATGKPTWACLSAPGLQAVVLPPLPLAKTVFIAADNDKAGLEAARKAAMRFTREGRQVRIVAPPEPGTDWNDAIARASNP